MASKSSFGVRKSGRLSLRRGKEESSSGKSKEEGPSQNDEQKNEEKWASVAGKKANSSEKGRSMIQSLRKVFSTKSRHSADGESVVLKSHVKDSERLSADKRLQQSPVRGSNLPYLTVMNQSYSPGSSTSFDASPLSRTPDRPGLHPFASPEDLKRVSRRLLSPSKRKSDEENENTACSPSPPKLSCGTSTPSLQGSPTEENEPRTPKSSKKPNLSLSRTATSTPRRLFGHSNDKDVGASAGLSPRKCVQEMFKSPLKSPPPYRQKSEARVYQSTKRCLHTARPDRLIGRDTEAEELEDFICERLDEGRSGSLYISGAPGTGKTAVVNHVVSKLQSSYEGLLTASINCMTLKDSAAVFTALHQELTGKPVKAKDYIKSMEKIFTTSKVVLVLDEIDQLDSKHHEVLYRIFEWPALDKSKLILLGIANALDLTDRVLPRLQASVTCRPNLMNFAPYTAVQITDILKNRLERDAIFEPSAINFCARKVSAVAGDIRKALDVCRRAVEMVETDARRQQVLRPTDCNSPTKRTPIADMKKVTITHISRVMSEVYGSSVTSANSTENDVPLQQKLAVCSLLVMVKNGKVKEVFLGKLHEAYTRSCRSQQMSPVDQSEFHSICCLLEARGIVALRKAKDTRLIKVSLKLDEQELEQTLKDKNLMARVLKDGLKG